jgi:hypothetical protein
MLPAPNPVLLPESASYAAAASNQRPSPLAGALPILLIAVALLSMGIGGVVLRRRGLLHR